MTNNTPDYEDNLYFACNKTQANDLACNKISLTKQWKKGELPEGFYFVYNGAEITIDYYLCDYWERHFDSDVQLVLAPVPSYEEWKEYQELDEENKKNVQLAIRFSIEADILKELLKQSRIYVKIETEDYDDRTVSKADKEEAKKLLDKIDEVLK